MHAYSHPIVAMGNPKKIYHLLISLIFLSSLTLSHSQNVISPQFMPPSPDCNPNDKKVLLQIINHFRNATSAFSTWGPDPNCCSWPNIICDNNGRVTSVTVAYSVDIGEIPPVVADLPYLTALRFFELNLTSIPRSITKLTRLQELDLVSNSLSGPIPDFLSKIKSLKLLILSSNKLSGSIPESFGSFKAGLTLQVADNHLSGLIPKSLGQANLAALDVSGNKFTGDVSFLFGKGKAIKSINLKKNLFKFDFTNVDLPQGLKSIDISHNEIYGSLPKQLGQLPLSYLDVSYNKLCGPIPKGPRFNGFNATRFANNKCLCGPPLAPCKK